MNKFTLPGAGWQTVTLLEREARGAGLVAAQFVKYPEPLLEHKARIYKDGRFIMQNSVVVGIDVSKNTLDYTWLPGGKIVQTPNTPKGIATLIATLQTLRPEIVVMEATGGYQTAAAHALFSANIPCAVVNPRQVRDFARSLNRLGKTDKLDAVSIAQFAQSRKLTPDTPKTPERVEIGFLLRRRDQLQAMITAEKNHLEQAPEPLRAEMQEHIGILAQRLKSVDAQIKQRIQESSTLAEQNAVIQSIPGIGPVTSATLLAFLAEITQVGRKQLCALVGVAPFNRDSGKYRGQRHIFAGRAQIRKILYCALRPCLQFNPVVKKWFNHFISQGKAYKVAAIACVRKLLVVIRAMLISNTHWNEKMHCPN